MMNAGILVVSVLALAGCSQGAQSVPSAAGARPAGGAETPPAMTGGVTIGHLVTHDAKVSLLATPAGLRVAVRDRDGKIVADGLSLGELERREPTLHRLVTSSVAGRTDAPDTYLDATLVTTPAAGVPGRDIAGSQGGVGPGGR